MIENITIEDGTNEDLVVVKWDGSGWYKRITENDPDGSYQCWIKVGFSEGQIRVSRPEQLCRSHPRGLSLW